MARLACEGHGANLTSSSNLPVSVEWKRGGGGGELFRAACGVYGSATGGGGRSRGRRRGRGRSRGSGGRAEAEAEAAEAEAQAAGNALFG